jgi:DtxR family Mn-dependent transcriptional regulator
MSQNTTRESRAVQDFLKAVLVLQTQHERVPTNTLAEALSIAAPSVTDMAARLGTAGLLDYQKHQGVKLTALGEQEAHCIMQRHQVIELFLVETLAYTLDEAHQEAERMEHVVSERFVAALVEKLGD